MADKLQGQASTGFAVRRVGVVGLGHMGHAFAANLIEDGYEVSVYDRNPKREATLPGATAAAQLADIAACDAVLTSLPDDDALAAVALGPEGLAGILAPPAVHVSTSTVSPDLSRRVAEGPNDAADEFWRFKSQFFPHFLYIRFDGCQLEHLFGGNETRPQ